MTTAAKTLPLPGQPLELCTGDQMTQEEFHKIYEQMPAGFRAELIGGLCTWDLH